MTDSYACPICFRVSYHPDDVREQWCNACHGATSEPPPPGFTWTRFLGGPMDGRGRLIEADFLKLGNSYELAWVQGEAAENQGRYVYDGEKFVHEP